MRDGEYAAQVDAEHEVPQALVAVDEVGEQVGAGVVDEHIHRAELLLDRGDGGAHRGRVGHVHGAPKPVDLTRKLARATLVDVANPHPGPFGCQQPGGGSADPRGSAGDERRLALESHAWSVAVRGDRRRLPVFGWSGGSCLP